MTMTTATVIATSSILSLFNPLLEGKTIKEGVYTIYDFALEDLEIGKKTILFKTGEKLITSPVLEWEFVKQEEGRGSVRGILITENSVYKLRLAS